MATSALASSGSDRLLRDWCAVHLGSPAVARFLRVDHLSAVHGLLLSDGREVVLKVRGHLDRHLACVQVQDAVWRAGIDCPRPLAGPAALVSELGPTPAEPTVAGLEVSAETWEGEGVAGLGDLSLAGWARLQARIVRAAPPVAELPTLEPPVPWLNFGHESPGRIWPPPASERWDPHRIIDRIDQAVVEAAQRSRERLSRADVAALPLVAGHGDFEAQNCRWVSISGGPARLVVHDWDSVVALPEAVLAGNAAATVVSVVDCRLTTLDQTEEYLAAYADARGRPWSSVEREVAYAAGTWVSAYNAAFEHLKGGPGPVTEGLRAQGVERLRRAGA